MLLLLPCLWAGLAHAQQPTEPPANQVPSEPPAVQPGQPVELTGEIIDLDCYLRDGSRGEHHRSCALVCAKNGSPLALLEDGTERVLPLAGATPASNPNEKVVELIALRVAVRGRLFERAESRVLVIETVEPLSQ